MNPPAFSWWSFSPYNYFRSKIEQLTGRMEEQATRLELSLARLSLKAGD